MRTNLNLGSGNDYRQGWVNVDVVDNGQVDVVADLNKKFPFKSHSVDEILASDILEHFTKEDGEKFLAECCRVLKTNGLLNLRTHDIYKIFSKFYEDPYVVNHFIYGDTSETGLFGAHKYSYDKDTISLLLKKVGFEVVSIKDEETNIFIVAKKRVYVGRNSKLNISVINQYSDFGGAEEYMLNLIKQFKLNNHGVFLATNKGKLLDYSDDINVQTEKIPIFLDIIGNYRGLVKSFLLLPYAIYFYSNLLYKFKRSKIDLILMSGFSEKMLISFLSLFFRTPVIWIEYGPLEKILKRNSYIPKIVYRLTGKIPKKIIVPTKNTRQDLLSQSRISLSKFELIPCGVEIENDFKKEKHGNKIVIGNISRQTKEKGQEYLIEAIPLIVEKYKNVEFLFVGDGPDRKFFINKAKKLKVDKYVTFTGFVDNAKKYYAKMDIFVFPSVWDLEGFGLVATEAMARKIPVIGNSNGPIKEVLGNGGGILVNVKNSKELSSAVIKLIEDKKYRDKIAISGFDKVKNNYDIKTSASKILDVMYDSI